MNKPVKIDFIGIGAQKAGTTWLDHRLRELPEFTLPVLKEIHYFDRDRKYMASNALSGFYLTRFFNYSWISKCVKLIFKFRYKRNLNIKTLRWAFKWVFYNYNDNWYLSLFSDLTGLKGEISPGYSMLERVDIQKMYALAPKAKIIFLIRNPIDRAWSQYRFKITRRKIFKPSSSDIFKIIEYINSDSQELRSNYSRTIENYSSIYPKDQILICFYDAIFSDPDELLTQIVDFIGGNSENVSRYCSLYKKVNVSKKIDCPPAVLDHLKSKYYDQLRCLAEAYGGYFTKWYEEEYGKIINSKDRILRPAFILGDCF